MTTNEETNRQSVDQLKQLSTEIFQSEEKILPEGTPKNNMSLQRAF